MKKKSKEVILLAEDKKYFYDENDSTYLSQGLRYLFPDWWSFKHQAYDKHTIEPVEGDVKIFPTDKSPNQYEVRQAGVGDCYLMAALISLAKTNPQAIKDCFVDGLDKIENKKNITIRFFYKNWNTHSSKYGETETIKICVNRDKVIMPQRIKDRALWPKIIEKAYAVYRAEGNGHFKDMKKLDHGTSAHALFAIAGKTPKSLHTGQRDFLDTGEKVINKDDVIDKIRKKLQHGKSLVCGFKKKLNNIKDAKTGENITIWDKHAYAIVGINDDKKYIRLIEPNKLMGRSAESNHKDSIEGGHVAMPFEEFKNNVDVIDYTGKN